MRKQTGWIGVALTVAAFVAARAWAAGPIEFKVSQATLMKAGTNAAPNISKDTFGPGLDSTVLDGHRGIRNELRYACPDIPEGDYCVGMPMLVPWAGYFGIGESVGWCLQLYHNDTRVAWTGHTEPLRPENAAEKSAYQAELRAEAPLHLKPGDVLRIVYDGDGGGYTLGPLRLYRERPTGTVSGMEVPDCGKPRTLWLNAEWTTPQRTPEQITQSCTLHNPGVRPRTFTLRVEARDYYMAPLMPDALETLTLAPGESVARTYAFKPSSTLRDRLTLMAEAPDMFPAVRLGKFFLHDRTRGPRPNTCLNGTDWQVCFVPGAEPGSPPPPNAAWKAVTIPSEQSATNGHCAWYRKQVYAPNVRGERIILKCGKILTEAWFYVNGTPVGHQFHGSQPFEVDLTAGFKPGATNELLIAARDWIAYSPKNQARVRNGEPLAVRQDLIDLVDYPAAENLGIGGSVWLEARPAVAVDDVFVVTSVREKKLTLKYRLTNTTEQPQTAKVAPTVWNAGQAVKTFPPQQVVVPARGSTNVWFEAGWRDPQYWSPDDPHLYALATTLQPATGTADRHWQRFGFREFWAAGHSFMLNGTRVKPKGCYGNNAMNNWPLSFSWDPERRLDAVWDYQVEVVRNRGFELSRTHLMDVKDEPVDLCDETGAMVKMEGEVHQVAFTFNTNFWAACLQRNVELVDIYKNHPSVVYWGCGNENMWGMIYLGAAASTFANHWQIKICQAMRDFDLMRRPIDWEADGDLFGKWEQHSLHYPRELPVYPDIPNGAWWGPWDGKTVAQNYQFGPIILGQKPITLGESFWITPSQPYPQTIILGDEAYKGGNYLWKGWAESSGFFINGFRDAEFAYLDTLALLPPLLKPQVVVLKQETTEFYGGRTLRRDVNVHNDLHYSARLMLRWSLTPQGGGKAFVSGARTLKLAPAELKRLTVTVKLPEVKEKTEALWKVELVDVAAPLSRGGVHAAAERRGHSVLHEEMRTWKICPPPALGTPPGLDLAVYDPVGETATALEKMGIRFTRLTDLTTLSGKALIVGKQAFAQPAQGAWREALAAFARDGGKVLILAQSEAPDFLPIIVTFAKDKKTTMSFVRAADHPVMAGLADSDLRWWADDHYVAEGNWQKPIKGRWLPLADIGTGDGLTQAPLIEVYSGQGSFLLCQFLVTEKALTAPPAGRMLQNMLDYLAAPACFRTPGRTAVFAGATSPLRKALEESRLVSDDLTGRLGELKVDKYAVAIVDAATALDEPSVAALRAFAEAGGHVLAHRGTPEKQALLEKLLGARLRFCPVDQEPQDIRTRVLRLGASGLLAGISNHELLWMSAGYLKGLRQEGGWSSVYSGGCPPAEQVADFFCWPGDDAGAKVVRLTRPGALLQAPVGKGYVALNQVRFDQTVPEVVPIAERLRALLLTNLGCDMKGDADAAQAWQKRLQQYQFTPIDLATYANRGTQDDKAAGLVGWANQGENDMRELPAGRQVFKGVLFLVGAPKCAAVLYSESANNTELPKEIKGIKVGMKADELFFAHAMAYGGATGAAFRYRVNYDDGTSVDIPIEAGKQVYDWWSEPARVADAMAKNGAFIAWQGHNGMTRAQNRWGVMLPGYEWPNPSPGKTIRDIDFLTVAESLYAPVPLLVGLTAATVQPDEGVVTDVINTRGIKVKLGTQEREVYYIGVAGIDEKHAYCSKALAAHKAMVVGQKVKLVYDVVRQNNAGQTLAYVYLGETWDMGTLVNGKLLEAGLGELGNFEGNDRLRMYLMNTAEPAKWRKVGMWAE